MTTWRDAARPIIARVIAEVGTKDRKALRAALNEAYPFGERKYHPYKIWCHEIRVQLGEVEFKPWRVRGERETVEPCAGQQELF